MAQLDRQYVGYVRVSTDDQAEHGVSIDAQRDKVRAFAELHNLPLARIVEDAGASAKSLERPGMAEVLHFLKVGGAGVIVAKLDRLTRSLRDWCELVETYFGVADGPRLLSASDSIETRTASGRLVLNILMAVAQCERETIVERTGQAMTHKRSKGERLGTVPYGWMLGEDGKTLAPCAAELGVMTLVRSLREECWTFQAIAAELDRLGIPSRSGRPWAISTVAKILTHSNAETGD